MPLLGRKTLKSRRMQGRRIDLFFEGVAKILLVAYLIFVLISWITYREAFRIDSVIVMGALTVNTEEIRIVAHDFLSKKIFGKIDTNNAVFYPKNTLKHAIASLDSRIKNVEISVRKKRNLEIQISEYVPSYLWCGSEDLGSATSSIACHLVDASGYVYTKSPNHSGYPFTVFRTNIPGNEEQGSPIGLFMLPNSEFEKISQMIAILEKSNVTISEVNQINEFDYSLVTDKSWVLLWSTKEDPPKSMQNLNLLLSEITRGNRSSSTPVSIDLRFGNKIFYK